MNRGVLSLVFLLVFVVGCATTAPRTEHGSARTGIERISPIRGAEINTQLGIGYLERGQLQIAMEKLELALQHDPDHVPAYLALAVIHDQIGNENQAERYLRQASRLAPVDGGTQNSYAVFLCRQGKYRDAERHFMIATQDPFYRTPAVAWANAGACARRSGDADKAEQYLRRALEMDPAYPDALYHLAEIYYQQGEAFRARAFLQRFEAAASPEAGALLLGYKIENQLNNASDARQYASRLEQHFPDSSEARELRSR